MISKVSTGSTPVVPSVSTLRTTECFKARPAKTVFIATFTITPSLGLIKRNADEFGFQGENYSI